MPARIGAISKDAVNKLRHSVYQTAYGHDDAETCVRYAILLIKKRYGKREILPYKIDHGVADHRAGDDAPLPILESFFRVDSH